LPEGGFVECAVAGGEHVEVEEFDPFAVGRFGNLTGIPAVAGEEIEVFGEEWFLTRNVRAGVRRGAGALH
jgi:hypothetical protein